MLSRTEIRKKALEVVSQATDVPKEKISEDSKFMDDLGLDSPDSNALVYQIQTAFDIDIPDAEAQKIVSFGDLCEYLYIVLEPWNRAKEILVQTLGCERREVAADTYFHTIKIGELEVTKMIVDLQIALGIGKAAPGYKEWDKFEDVKNWLES